MCVSMFAHRWLHVCAIHMQMCAEVRGYLRWPVLTNTIYISSWSLSLDLGFAKEAGQIGHQVPSILQSPLPQCWDCKCELGYLAF